ncbi:tetraspanin-5-like protein [Leptotrombidium deliense]|uniref:Tetraspanin n=1 Tax=Leptotrombidium deliense TaxID=299467 RepID=A0A443SDB4_9ACAR|nr:tetraspanin-5-like protein [Leptotrombidium deliense]
MVDRRHSRHRTRHSNSGVYQQHLRLPQNDDEYSYISPCVKYSLFFFNLVFWLVGGTFVALGTYSFLIEYSETNLPKVQSILDLLIHISLALIIIGITVFSMSLFGCLGALRENLCLLKLYSLMLLLLFIGEIILSSIAFMFPNSFSFALKEKLSNDPIKKYRDDANLQNLIDIVQTNFKCCGVSDKGYKDWSKNIYFNCTQRNPSPEKCAVPYSCCRNQRNFDSGLINIMCGYNVQNISSVVEVNKYIYTRGCIEAFTEVFERNLNLVAMVCLGSAVVQLLAMFLARALQGQIMAQRARWM